MIWPLLLLAAESGGHGCRTVQGSAILGSDLAAADARFSALPADTNLGYAPMPGSHRSFSGMELRRIAVRFGIEGEFGEVCFAHAMRSLEAADLTEPLRAGLKREGAEIEIVDWSRFPAPAGEIVFPVEALARPPITKLEEPVMWRGFVRYGANGRFSIWARVRLKVAEDRLVAREDLPAGQAVTPSQVQVEHMTVFPSREEFAASLEQLTGRTIRAPIRAGSSIPLSAFGPALHQSNGIARGDLVEVQVDSGLAHLKFEAHAETGAALGETVSIRNPKSGKIFAARVSGKGKAVVESEGETH